MRRRSIRRTPCLVAKKFDFYFFDSFNHKMEQYAQNLLENELKEMSEKYNISSEMLVKRLYSLHYELEELGDSKNRSDGININIKQGQKRKRGRPKKK